MGIFKLFRKTTRRGPKSKRGPSNTRAPENVPRLPLTEHYRRVVELLDEGHDVELVDLPSGDVGVVASRGKTRKR